MGSLEVGLLVRRPGDLPADAVAEVSHPLLEAEGFVEAAPENGPVRVGAPVGVEVGEGGEGTVVVVLGAGEEVGGQGADAGRNGGTFSVVSFFSDVAGFSFWSAIWLG